MANNLSEMKKVMTKWGMKIHWGKTKVMMVDWEKIEVQNMKYPGAMCADTTCEEEIEHRLGAVTRVVGVMRNKGEGS